MFRPSGECVLIDFGLSHHNQLPDLLQEEFRLPYGTAPYMAPERLLGVRDDPRSDLFSLGVLLYFFTTGERPFGESETLRGMRRRLWRDPYPPRKLKAGLSALAAGNRAAVPGDRAGLAASDGFPTGVRSGASRSGQIDRALGAAAARSPDHGVAPPLQSQLTPCRSRNRTSPRNWLRGPSWWSRSTSRKDQERSTNICAATAAQLLATLPSARLACLQRAQARPHHHRPDARRAGQQQAHRPARRAPALGFAA